LNAIFPDKNDNNDKKFLAAVREQPRHTILVKRLGTLCTIANTWCFCPPLSPDTQHNVDVDSSKVDALFQHNFGGEEFGKLNNDFPKKCLSRWRLASVLRTG